jgi:hypothetical protein
MVLVVEESAIFALVLAMSGHSWSGSSFYRSRVAALERALAPRFALGEDSLLGLVLQRLEVNDDGSEVGSFEEVSCRPDIVGGGCSHADGCAYRIGG